MANIADWKEKIKVGKDFYASNVEPKINLWRDYYKGKQWSKVAQTRYEDLVVDNQVFSSIKTVLPSINFRNPKIFVKAKKKPYLGDNQQLVDTGAMAEGLEIVLNYYFKELKIKKQISKIGTDALLGHWGLINLGYTLETDKFKSKGKEEIEINEYIKSESPFAVRFSPRNFIVDPECKEHDLSDAGWIGLKWVKTLSDIQANPKYKNTQGLKTNFTIDTKFTSQANGVVVPGKVSQAGKATIWDRVEGWDIWDKRKQKLITIVLEHDKELQNIDWPLNLEGFPVETLSFNEVPDEQLPLADIDIYMSEQDALNRLSSLELSHVKRVSERKYLTEKGSISEDEKEKVLKGGDGATGEYAEGKNPEKVMFPLRNATISQDLYIVKRNKKDSIREQQGIAHFEQGGTRNFETATEPALIAQGVQVRREERRQILEDFIKLIVRKLAHIIQQTIDRVDIALDADTFNQALGNDFLQSKLYKITGSDGILLQPWLALSKEDLQGDYDFDIEIGSTQPINDQTRKQDALTLAQTVQGNPYVNQGVLAKIIVEALAPNQEDQLLLDPQQVEQGLQQSAEAEKQHELQIEQIKAGVKVQGDQLESETDLTISREKNQTDLTKEMLKAMASGSNGGSGALI